MTPFTFYVASVRPIIINVHELVGIGEFYKCKFYVPIIQYKEFFGAVKHNKR